MHPPNKLPNQLSPEQVTAIVDTREQTPWPLEPLATVHVTLDTGDYSLLGLEHVVRIERKTLVDLVACVGRERDRFDREVQRLLAFPVGVLIVEATWAELELAQWRGKVTAEQVIGSLLGWQAAGLSIHMAGSRERASTHAARILFTVARRRYREFRKTFKAAARDCDWADPNR